VSPTAEQQQLVDAILRHPPFALSMSIRQALQVAGEYVPEEEAASCRPTSTPLPSTWCPAASVT